MKKMIIITTIFIAVLLLAVTGMMLYMKNMLSKPVQYTLPGMDQVQVQKDQVYKTLPDKNLRFDVYSPSGAGPDEKLPVVIMVHGNGPDMLVKNAKDWKCFETYGQLFSVSGLKAISFNHRSGNTYKNIREEAQDVDDLIAHVRANAGQFGIDPDRLCLFVFSGGGPYLSNVLKAKPEYISCIVGYYTVLDLSILPKTYTKGLGPEEVREFSPIVHLQTDPEKVPPLMIVKAARDRVKEIMQGIDNFTAAAAALGIPVTYMVHEQGKHGFDMLNDDERTREIIELTLRFIKAKSE